MMLGKLTAAVAAIMTFAVAAAHAETLGVTESEIKVGATFPFSGPASPLSNTGKGLIAYVNSVNDRGGINGRKINLITYDDAYSPPKSVEQTRKLVENDEVAFLFSPLGTPGISATKSSCCCAMVGRLSPAPSATVNVAVPEGTAPMLVS